MIGRALALAALAAAPALAQEVFDARAAGRLLFNERRAELVALPQPSVDQRLMALLQDRRRVAGFLDSVPYYGAIAVSPDQGLVEEAIVAVGNFHSSGSAAAAALGRCDAQRPAETRACVIVAHIRPRGWRARALQLSAGATATFRREFRRGQGERAFAISPASGGYGIGRGPGAAAAAIAACNAAGGMADCQVAISD
jgi:hypothetical protein